MSLTSTSSSCGLRKKICHRIGKVPLGPDSGTSHHAPQDPKPARGVIFPRSSMNLLNKKQLAEEMGRSATYVSGMVRQGYRMKYGTKTTLSHALAWLVDQSLLPDGGFRLAQAYPSLAVPKSQRQPGVCRQSLSRRPRGHRLAV